MVRPWSASAISRRVGYPESVPGFSGKRGRGPHARVQIRDWTRIDRRLGVQAYCVGSNFPQPWQRNRQPRMTSTPAAFSHILPHLLIENAFGGEMVARLLAHAMEREASFTATTVGRQKMENAQIRRSRVIRDFGALKADLEAAFLARLDQAISALRLTPFGVDSLSLELAAHGDGDFYRRHIDTFIGDDKARTDRILTGVYYFHAQPKAFSGGELRLFSLRPPEHGGGYLDLSPPCDSLLLFPAWVPHEVRPVSCPGGDFGQSRFAINCWYNGTG